MTQSGEKPQNKIIRAPWERLPLARGPDVVFFVVGVRPMDEGARAERRLQRPGVILVESRRMT